MLKTQHFDVLEAPFPTKGMVPHISSSRLSFDGATYLENIIPSPLGEGHVRYGTRPCVGVNLPARAEIKDMFSYGEEIILYTSCFQADLGIEKIWIQTASSLEMTFKSNETLKWYQEGTRLLLTFEYKGQEAVVGAISQAVSLEGNRLSLGLDGMGLPSDLEHVTIKQIAYSEGHLYAYNPKTSKTKLLQEGLGIHTDSWGVVYKNKLLITNGVDPITVYDGKGLKALTTLPHLSKLFVAHNRVWGLSPYADKDNPMLVQFMQTADALPEKEEAWLDPKTKALPFIDISSKGTQDQIIAIHQVGDKVCFFGKNHIQVWKGFNPLDPDTFVFERLIPEGAVSAKLIQPYGNDVVFVSLTGMKTISSFNMAQQMGVNALSAFDQWIRGHLEERLHGSFYYPRGGFLGFKVGNCPLLIQKPLGDDHIWTLFTRAFQKAESFLVHQDQLYLSMGKEVLLYQDGKTEVPDFRDEINHKAHPIPFKWTLPLLSFKGKRFQGKRYQVQMDVPSSFMINPQNKVFLKIYGDQRERLDFKDNIPFYFQGDVLGQHMSAITDQETGVVHLNTPQREMTGRAGFVAKRFYVTLEGEMSDGPLRLESLTLYGRKER